MKRLDQLLAKHNGPLCDMHRKTMQSIVAAKKDARKAETAISTNTFRISDTIKKMLQAKIPYNWIFCATVHDEYQKGKQPVRLKFVLKNKDDTMKISCIADPQTTADVKAIADRMFRAALALEEQP